MSVLICNVGGSDLVCAALPKERRGERPWAEELLARYDELRPLLHLPIIGKALRYLADQGVVVESLILIASDQPAPAATVADRRFWESDTCPTAAAIARYLADGADGLPPVPPERIATWIIADEAGRGADPSDYDLVLGFLERRMALLAAERPRGPAFLEVTGGTPAMTTGLLIAGAEVFGARAELLSIHPRRAQPAALGAGRRLLAAPLRATLLSNAATYAYDAAIRTFHEHRPTILDRLPAAAGDAIAALLSYAHCRYSFDFPGARAALAARPAQPEPWHDALAALDAEVAAPDRLALLAEVIHGAAARYDAGLYADFLTQLVRFEENLLRHLCLERGARFVSIHGGADDDGSLISRAWLRSLPFRLRKDRDDGYDRASSRGLLRDLAGQLAQARGEELRPLLDGTDQLRPLVYLRNELTHSLDGVRRADLAERFGGHAAPPEHADRIVPHLGALYAQVAGRPLPTSPFGAINGLLGRLLRAAER